MYSSTPRRSHEKQNAHMSAYVHMPARACVHMRPGCRCGGAGMRVCRMLQIRDTQLISSLPPSLCVSALPGHDVFSDVIELGRGAQSNLLVGVEDNLNRGSALLRRQAQEAPRDGHQKRDAALVVCT